MKDKEWQMQTTVSEPERVVVRMSRQLSNGKWRQVEIELTPGKIDQHEFRDGRHLSTESQMLGSI